GGRCRIPAPRLRLGPGAFAPRRFRSVPARRQLPHRQCHGGHLPRPSEREDQPPVGLVLRVANLLIRPVNPSSGLEGPLLGAALPHWPHSPAPSTSCEEGTL